MATAQRPPKRDALMTPADVARIFQVGTETLQGWAEAGRLTTVRTLAGRRRYRAGDVRRLLEQSVD